MFMMLLGIFWFGQAFSIYGAITRAAQEGARAGAVPYCTTCAGTNTLAQYSANAVSVTNAALVASKLDPNLAQSSPTPPSLPSCNGGTPVACPLGAKICVQAPVQLTSGPPGFCGVSVSFRYPFQFWLPFTSLNKQRILISASARVRLETQ
jgi:hypothetical protein